MPNRDLTKDTREQPFWDEHAEFIDKPVDERFIFMGGPLVDEGGSLLIVEAEDENEVRERITSGYLNVELFYFSVLFWKRKSVNLNEKN